MQFFSLLFIAVCQILQKKKSRLKKKKGKLKEKTKENKMEESLMEKEDLELNCPEFTEFSEQMLSRVSFWVEGTVYMFGQ